MVVAPRIHSREENPRSFIKSETEWGRTVRPHPWIRAPKYIQLLNASIFMATFSVFRIALRFVHIIFVQALASRQFHLYENKNWLFTVHKRSPVFFCFALNTHDCRRTKKKPLQCGVDVVWSALMPLLSLRMSTYQPVWMAGSNNVLSWRLTTARNITMFRSNGEKLYDRRNFPISVFMMGQRPWHRLSVGQRMRPQIMRVAEAFIRWCIKNLKSNFSVELARCSSWPWQIHSFEMSA